jgi:hypothetical protein
MMNNSDNSCRYTAFLCGKGTFYISIAVLVLFILNCVIIGLNRATQNDVVNMQQEIADKGAKIQQSQVFANIYQNLLQALGAAAVVKKDDQIKKMLSDNGIKIQPKPAAPAVGAAPAPEAPPAAPAAPAAP